MTTQMPEAACNGHSMVGELRRVMVCSPGAAGWADPGKRSTWKERGFLHEPQFAIAKQQHEDFCGELEAAGAEVIPLPTSSGLTLDAVYAHDPSLMTDFGALLMHPGKSTRVAEAQAHRALYQSLGVRVLGEITPPGTGEAGDMVWLGPQTLLAGNGYRTNRAGIEQLQRMLGEYGVQVVPAPLPYGSGPSTCLHLMSLMSILDEHTVLVDLPWLAVETVELLRSRGFRFIEIDASERESLACNVLALGRKRVLAIAENKRTNRRLSEAGFDVGTFGGSELCVNGGGGPTCLTRPLLRT